MNDFTITPTAKKGFKEREGGFNTLLATEKVLLAIEEKRKWENREKELLRDLEKVREKRKILIEKLAKTKKQVAYYNTLADSMKEGIKPETEPTTTISKNAQQVIR